MRARRVRSALLRIAALLVVLSTSVFFLEGRASASTPINGGGSGFAGLEIQQWQADVDTPARGNLIVNYSSQSSGIGRQYFASNTWDYGASDIRYIPGIEQSTENELQSGRCGGRPLPNCFQYVPVSAGGLGFMYNLRNADGSRVTSLKLTAADVCGIFTGRLTSWGQLAGNNPFLAGSGQSITPVVRQDQAGESYVLSEYCIAEDPADWSNFTHFQQTAQCTAGLDYTSTDAPSFNSGQPIPIWPSTLEGCRSVPNASGSEGVADTVHDPNQGAGAITYDAAGYAVVRQLPNASVQNAAGAFTLPNSNSVTIALEFATAVGDGTFKLDFNESSGADPRAYNPSTYSYILAQTGGFDTGRGSTLGRFLCYAIGAGQVRAPALLYAELSPQVEAISEAATVQVPGAPSASQCLAGAPPPPAPPPLELVKPAVLPVTTTPATPSRAGAGSTASGAGAATSGSTGTSVGGELCGSPTITAPTASSSTTTSTTIATSRRGGPTSTTASTSTSTTSTTTVPCSSASSSGGSSAALLGNGGQNSLASASSHNSNSYNALLAIFEGAAICAVGVAFAGHRKKAST